MTEITVESTDSPEESDLEEQDEHDAAREAGAAEVHKDNAEEAAAEAEAAAEVAVAAAGNNAESLALSESAAARAEEAAGAANSGARAVAEAITAQTAVLQSLLAKLDAPAEKSPAEETPVKQTKDRAPGKKRRSGLATRYYGG